MNALSKKGFSFVVFGCIFFIIGIFGLSKTGTYSSTELPNGEKILIRTQSFIVDSCGAIYIGDSHHGIVQVYDKDGEFLRNWDIETHGGAIILFFTEDRDVAVVPVRDKFFYYCYTKEGVFVGKRKNTFDLTNLDPMYHITSDGVEYTISGKQRPRISRNGELLVYQKFYKNNIFWLFIFLTVIGFIIFIIPFLSKNHYK